MKGCKGYPIEGSSGEKYCLECFQEAEESATFMDEDDEDMSGVDMDSAVTVDDDGKDPDFSLSRKSTAAARTLAKIRYVHQFLEC